VRQIELAQSDEPFTVVSADSHVGPSVRRQLREYCPSQYLPEFDEFADEVDAASSSDANLESRFAQFATQATALAVRRSANCPGLQDASIFLADMERDGIAASVIFAGGGNGEPVPWVGGLIQSSKAVRPELLVAGARLWNRWLADFTSISPGQLRGVAQVPLCAVEAAVEEVRWAGEHGLGALNFPAPRADILPYNDLAWEPLWDAVEESGLPLVTHGSSGDPPNAPESNLGFYRIISYETRWLSRRGLSHMIFGGVFERHPGVKLVFTEQRADWVGGELKLMDSIYCDPNREDASLIPKRPSEYWRSNCYIGGSFLAPYEVELRDEIGPRNLMWGSDYPHPEGTWPRTSLALRNTFASVPEPEVRLILGSNAIEVFGLDAALLEPIAARVGPRPSELSVPVSTDELPEHRGLAFREFGAYA
jgi:predicted TIM-barrel fold metal-dependent hydrolase